MASFKYDPIDLARPAFRLARLLRGSGIDIQCDIFQAFLNEPESIIPYEALSYTWGNTELADSIMINGNKLGVTNNLYLALQYLRSEDEDRILWIDSLCINQGNNKEKGHQVQQMGNIYRRAERVIIWLGLATYETNVFMDLVKQLEKESINYSRNSWRFPDQGWQDIWLKIQSDLSILHSDLEMRQRNGLESLFGRSWFSRVWVLQEVANARAAIIVCGLKSVSARIFTVVPSLMRVSVAPHLQAILDIMPGRSRQDSWWSQKRDLHTLLVKFGESDASDPRDNIYALLGLSSDASNSDLLQADYSKPVHKVMRDAASFLVGYPALRHSKFLSDWTMPQFLKSVSLFSNVAQGWAHTTDNGPLLRLLLAALMHDINLKDSDVITPLLIAVQLECGEIEKLFIAHDHIDMNLTDYRGDTPLVLAIRKNYKEIVKILLARGDVNVNRTNNRGKAPLHEAMEMDDQETLKLLLSRKDVEMNPNSSRGTPLLSATADCDMEIVRLLLTRGDVDVNYKNRLGETPLHIAVLRNDAELVELLLTRHDVDVNARDKAGIAPLLIAVKEKDMEIVKLLLRHKDIDVNTKD